LGWRTYLGTAAAVGGFLLVPASSASAGLIGDCSSVNSIPATPATGVTCTVTSESDLSSILEQVDSAYATYVQDIESSQTATLPSTTTIEFSNSIQLNSDLPFVNGPVVVNGQNNTLTSAENGSGVPEYRGFLLYNSEWQDHDCGNTTGGAFCQYAAASYVPVTIENLTIADTAARGGNGAGGAGGGAGFGGAVFAANGVALTLSGDSFSNNSAIGGAGGIYTDTSFATGGGGGGGMGGAGANGSASGYAGGGGGLGADASGGDGSGGSAGNAGIAYGLETGGWGNDLASSPGAGSTAGGAGGGGGGGGGSAGAGGGAGGLNPSGELPMDTNGEGSSGGLYGIGGGGGGGGGGALGDAWGGLGGGSGFPNGAPNGGSGGQSNGFGGGSAAPTSNGGTPGSYVTAAGDAGFGAGNGINNGTSNGGASAWLGGGGAGMGGAVFVQMGATVAVDGAVSEAGATATGGSGACSGSSCAGNGSAYGNAIFLQGDGGNIENGVSAGSTAGSSLTFSPAAGQTQTFDDGIADELSETYVPSGEVEEESDWSFTLNGAGTLELAGNTSVGGGTLSSGTLVIPTAANFHGNVTINSGATMILAGVVTGNVTLNSGGTLCAGQTPSNFTNNGGAVTTNCTTPPTTAINSPASGGTYSIGQVVSTSFQCSAGTNTVLSSCKDSNGVSGTGNGAIKGTLNTATAGVYTYTVTATDSDGKTATTSITYAVSSPCKTTISFGLVQLTATCLQPSANANTYSTPGPLTINGLTLPALPGGALYVATEPTTASPGGQLGVQAPAVNVSLPINIGGSDGVTFDVGAFTWNLPAAPSGGVGYAAVQSLTLAPKQLLKGMKLGGSATMDIGKDSSGAYYTSFVLTVDLPDMFKSGPSGNAAGLTGTASVRVDAQGAHFNGLEIQVSNAYVGTLQVKSACFAYLPDGDTGVGGCPQPAVPATPLGALSCSAGGGDSWQGSADIVLPTKGAPELSLYGSVTGGALEELGASASNLKIELADDVFLNSVGVTMCLPNSTEPFSIQGTVQLGAIQQGTSGYLVNVNGSIEYRDPWQGQPWTLDAAGEVTVGGTDIGSGDVSFYGDQYLYFQVEASLNLMSIVSVEGSVEGWLETQSPNQFNVQGDISLSLSGVGSFDGSGAVSSKGMSGCASVGGISYWEPEKDSDWEWYEPWLIHWVQETVNWQAGFGYYWGASSPSVWATSCDIGNYELAAPAGVEASAGAHSAAANTTGFKVENAGLPVAVKINGAGGAPRVKITTPSGRVIAPPAGSKIGEKIPGVGMLLENKPAHATMLLLTKPAKGGWHVTPLSGSVRVTSIQTAKIVPPPEVVGAAKSLAGGRVGLGVGYALAAGEKMTLFAAGPHHSQQVIGVANGVRCPGAHHSGPASQLCEHIRFKPVYGPSGKRTIYGAVTNHKGLSVATVKIASIKVRFPKPAASKPALLRKGTSVQIDWAPVLDASKYAVSVVFGDGRKLAYTTRKLTLTLKKLAKTDSVKATVWPVMPDGVIGKSAGRTLKNGATRAGSKPKRKPKLSRAPAA
jgi:hypothetical protein